MYRHYINGKLQRGTGAKQYRIINPATEEIAGEYTGASAEQTGEALDAARIAFAAWSKLPMRLRGEWMEKLKIALLQNKEELLDVLMSETGKPLTVAQYDFGMIPECLDFFREEAGRISGSIINDIDGKFRNLVIRQPLGVVVGFLAWNFPLLNIGYKIGPVLASGCTCVLKPSSRTPLSTMLIGRILERINFPPGVINIIAGPGDETGKILNQSKIPGMITLIGSIDAGKKIITDSGTSIKRFSLELGGNAPVIIMPDADIDAAAEKIIDYKFTNTGQICVAPNRVFVHEKVHDAFLEAAVSYTGKIKLGWGREAGARMGPVIAHEERERIFRMIKDAVNQGAVLLCGGTVPENRQKGYFITPAILDRASPDMSICRNEIFGPVLPVITFTDTAEAVREANNTEYGLAAYLFTRDTGNVFRISESLEFGNVCVNEPFFAVNMPHGGIKDSGIGFDCSKYSLEEYYSIKRISIRI
ncbi:MAG: NAD-dependent succinate-semialdehyde dehydrogenase [Spirochaetes bacterium GWF1_41_5]|nr:MAG: NAD-dependent succinate-semialdehyde dehydrogenase [Spirochaetes bacterium GWF1_41_5]HBE01572.1 NAD-dependent succinate-semialdehyde dehydrogenase [Spirochaetia bacterium]